MSRNSHFKLKKEDIDDHNEDIFDINLIKKLNLYKPIIRLELIGIKSNF